MAGEKVIDDQLSGERTQDSSVSTLDQPSFESLDFSSASAAEQIAQEHEDFIDAPVPKDKRYSTLTMTLLWITMLTNFPMVIIGFEFYRTGFSLTQVVAGTIAGSLALVAFQYFSGYIGARTGLNYSLLMEPLFGRLGVRVICAIWSLMFVGWYALNAVLMVDAVKGLFGISIWTPLLAAPILAAMAINNWFGMKGLANFARYLAAPVLILWVLYAFTKSVTHTSIPLALAHGTQTFGASLVVIPVLVIGNATWGNEADFFRYGKSSKLLTLLPLIASVIVGTLLFPTTGWLLGNASHAVDTAAFTKFMNDYTFGAAWLAVLVLTIGYFAVNDGNLYGAINAFENIWKIKRRNAVVLLVIVSIFMSFGLSYCPNALDAIASLNSVVLPCVTMAIICEFFVVRRFLSQTSALQVFRQSRQRQFRLNGASKTVWLAAAGAVVISWAVGLAVSGIIPQLKFLNSGIWILYPWCSAFVIYGIFRALQIYGVIVSRKNADLA